MSLSIKILLVILLLQASCGGKSTKANADLNEANKLLSEYLVTGNKEYLLESYEVVKSHPGFIHQSMDKPQYELVSSILMHLRKYDELKVLVSRNDSLVRNKEVALNLIKALQVWPQDSMAAKGYIDENLAMINNQISENPTDSLLYVDYFIMRLYRVGRQEILLDLDSFRVKDTVFSPIFHDHVLRDVIEEYPNDFLFPNN